MTLSRTSNSKHARACSKNPYNRLKGAVAEAVKRLESSHMKAFPAFPKGTTKLFSPMNNL